MHWRKKIYCVLFTEGCLNVIGKMTHSVMVESGLDTHVRIFQLGSSDLFWPMYRIGHSGFLYSYYKYVCLWDQNIPKKRYLILKKNFTAQHASAHGENWDNWDVDV